MEGYLSGVLIIRIVKFWGLSWGTPILGNYHIGCRTLRKDPFLPNRA